MNFEFWFVLRFQMNLDVDFRPKVLLQLYVSLLSATVSASVITDKIGFGRSLNGMTLTTTETSSSNNSSLSQYKYNTIKKLV